MQKKVAFFLKFKLFTQEIFFPEFFLKNQEKVLDKSRFLGYNTEADFESNEISWIMAA